MDVPPRGGPGDGQVVPGGGETVVWRACLDEIMPEFGRRRGRDLRVYRHRPDAANSTAGAPRTAASRSCSRPHLRPSSNMRTIILVQEVVRRWWNGVWGRPARRDVWLVRQTRWTVVARACDTETGKVLRWEYESEPEALGMVERLLRGDTAGQWREQDRGGPPAAPQRGRRPGAAAAPE